MERVIVTVRLAHEARGRDLEVPAEIEAAHLAELIAEALQWRKDPAGRPVRYEIRAEPPGRALRPGESLADAGAWDGSWLVLQPVDDGAIAPKSVQTAGTPSASSAQGPVSGWQPLGMDLPAPTGPEQGTTESEKSQSGFVWKRLD